MKEIKRTKTVRHSLESGKPASTRLGDYCEKPQYGYTAGASYEPRDCQFLRITDLQEQRIEWLTVPWCEANDRDIERYGLSHGDVLVARIGATTGSTAIIVDPPKSVFASYLIRLRPNQHLNPFFLYFYTKSRQFLDWIDAHKDSNLKGGVNVPVLLGAPIHAPPETEQGKIAAILWKLQRAIAIQDKLLKATADLKQSAMQRLFTHSLRGEPPKDTEIGPMPESWRGTTLGELCSINDGAIQTGPFGSQLHAREYQPEGIPVVNPTHLLGNKINHADVPRISLERASDLSRHALRTGDVLFARRGQIGRHGFVRTEEEGWICGTGCFLVRVRHPKIVNDFLPCFLSVAGVVAWLEANAAGAIMPNLNNTVLGHLPVYYPQSKSDQSKIAAALATLDRKLAHHRAKRAALDALFQTTLHQLMTGQIRVASLDIDTSEVTTLAEPKGEAA